MASFAKFTDDAVQKLIKHDDRRILQDKNEDIDPDRTGLNVDLTPARQMSKWAYYKTRKSEVYCYKRSDIKTVAGCIVTLPREITESEEQKRFFERVTDFLTERYGKENVLSVSVHYDEGKRLYRKDQDGNLVRGPDGKPVVELHIGQPHLHFLFLPVTKIDHEKLMKKRNHVKAMEQFSEKISAADVLTKKELQSFHPALQKYLDQQGFSCNVNSGVTKAQGRNITVSEYKKDFENPYIKEILTENARLKEKVEVLEKELEKEKDKTKSEETSWRKTKTWGKKEKTWDR